MISIELKDKSIVLDRMKQLYYGIDYLKDFVVHLIILDQYYIDINNIIFIVTYTHILNKYCAKYIFNTVFLDNC